MKKALIMMSVLPCLMCVQAQAYANGGSVYPVNPNFVSPAQSQQGVYIGGEVGGAALFTNTNIDPNNYRIGDFAFGGYAGYKHALTNNFLLGLEGGYQNLGNSRFGRYGGLYIKQQLGYIQATGTYVFNTGFDLFGKAGAAYVYQTSEFRHGKSFNGEQVLPMLSLGGGYNFNQHLSLNLTGNVIIGQELDRTSNTKDVAGSASVMLGLNYRF